MQLTKNCGDGCKSAHLFKPRCPEAVIDGKVFEPVRPRNHSSCTALWHHVPEVYHHDQMQASRQADSRRSVQVSAPFREALGVSAENLQLVIYCVSIDAHLCQLVYPLLLSIGASAGAVRAWI